MARGTANIPKKCCINCNFLALGSDGLWALIDQETRDGLKARNTRAAFIKLANHPGALGCYKRVWDEANWRKDAPSVIGELRARRRETCFFFPFTPGMVLKVAAELEERAADRREAGKDRTLTRGAFIVAFLALIAAIAATILNWRWNVWTYYHPRPTDARQVESPAEGPEAEGED